jgi:hypothetical protein
MYRNDLTLLSLLSTVNTRFPNLNWYAKEYGYSIYSTISSDFLNHTYFICISRHLEEEEYYSLLIDIDIGLGVIIRQESEDVNDILTNLEDWLIEMKSVFNKAYIEEESKPLTLPELLDNAVKALKELTEHKAYVNESKLWFSEYSPDMIPEDGIIGCEQLKEYLKDKYE